MEINRDSYLQQLIERKHNGLVKVITGLRRVGKSYLLFNLFKRHLLDSGVKPSHIVEIALDQGKFESLQNPIRLAAYLREHVKGRMQRPLTPLPVMLPRPQTMDPIPPSTVRMSLPRTEGTSTSPSTMC